MKLILFIIMITTILFAEPFKDDGQVRIESNIEKAKATATATLKKAKACNIDSMKLMAKYYENGYGVKINIKKAKYWKAKATAEVTLKQARAGNIDSMKLMSEYYENGYGVKADIKKAQYWKKKVNQFSKDKQANATAVLKRARESNVYSMKLMVEYYESGYGVEINSEKAEYWKKKINLLSKENRDKKESLTKDKQDEEEKLAREKQEEEEKLAREKQEEEEKLAREKQEEERLAREKQDEEKRLAREKQDEEERLAKEKKYEEERPAREKAQRLKTAKENGFSSYPIDTYIDTDTKLMWQDNKDAKSVNVDWNGAKDYCQNLTIDEYSDWKLPSYLELLSIFTYKKDKYTIKDGFNNVVFMKYWSNSENKNSNTFAWHVNFREGEAIISSKSIKHYVRCARGGPASQAFKITD